MSLSISHPLAAISLLLGGVGIAQAQPTVVRHGAEGPSPILTGVTVPAGLETLYLSGQVPPVADKAADPATPAAYGDTKTQTLGIFRKIETLLAAQGYGLKDVVKLTVFLVGDPKLGGKQDFKGFSEGYAQFFGTAEQPNKVARSTVQVAALANPGFLVEIEATAVKAK
ncbi:RidA family protein [Sphingobium sp. BYY-5]|uniref:RidA family protein n=1 Tax=Sphingobium sp. BYY-5 TaxID=2926400 RepID=UPI001FA6DAE1|nr:RidA family protein [Sphingobium sp. BYY-5]MCI4589351.1 RidA family protein [Sphingobium sp. BYY-5]